MFCVFIYIILIFNLFIVHIVIKNVLVFTFIICCASIDLSVNEFKVILVFLCFTKTL